MWRTILKAAIFSLVWVVFPFWFFLWLVLSAAGLKALSLPWGNLMKDVLASAYSL